MTAAASAIRPRFINPTADCPGAPYALAP